MKKGLVLIIILSIFLQMGVPVLAASNSSLWTAVILGNNEEAKALIKAGVDVNVKDRYGDTALMDASYRGYTEVVKTLIGAGADLNIKDKDGDTALSTASNRGYTEVAKALIEAGADINSKDIDGNTALMDASLYGYTEVAKALIGAGADINSKDKYGSTALSTASNQGYTEVAKALIEAGADINSKDIDGYTALMNASYHGYTEVVKTLIEAGADLNIKNKDGDTAIDLAGKANKTVQAKNGGGFNIAKVFAVGTMLAVGGYATSQGADMGAIAPLVAGGVADVITDGKANASQRGVEMSNQYMQQQQEYAQNQILIQEQITRKQENQKLSNQISQVNNTQNTNSGIRNSYVNVNGKQLPVSTDSEGNLRVTEQEYTQLKAAGYYNKPSNPTKTVVSGAVKQQSNSSSVSYSNPVKPVANKPIIKPETVIEFAAGSNDNSNFTRYSYVLSGKESYSNTLAGTPLWNAGYKHVSRGGGPTSKERKIKKGYFVITQSAFNYSHDNDPSCNVACFGMGVSENSYDEALQNAKNNMGSIIWEEKYGYKIVEQKAFNVENN